MQISQYGDDKMEINGTLIDVNIGAVHAQHKGAEPQGPHNVGWLARVL